MKINISDTGVHLEGDWTLTDVTQSALDSLAVALQQLEAIAARRIDVDCQQINAIDTTGQQILYVWLQCLGLRGIEPELVNIPKNLQNTFKACRSSTSAPAGPSTQTLGKTERSTRPLPTNSASPMRSAVNS